MTPERQLPSLPAAPAQLTDASGAPHIGTYAGGLARVDLGALRGRWDLPAAERPFRRKRWTYAFVATPEVTLLQAVVDLGYSATAFALVLDARERRVLADVSFLGLPLGPMAGVNDRPGPGLRAHLRTLGASLQVRRGEEEERYTLAGDVLPLRSGSAHRLRWDVQLLAAGGPPALTVVAPVEQEGRVNVTQKWSGLLSFGTLEAGGRRYRLDGGVGGVDYTCGYLARATAWRWAFAAGRLPDGTPLGLNLVEGFNDKDSRSNENALWVGRRLLPLGRARFDFNAEDVLDPWRLRTEDGGVDLRFRPVCVHREAIDVGLVKSHFAQPVGTFEGHVTVDGQRVPVAGLPGVTESQAVRW